MAYERYFEFRGVKPEDYADFTLPAYLRRALAGFTKPRILDFGCGFGQLLQALQAAGYPEVEGVDVEPEAIAHCRARGQVCFDGGPGSTLDGTRQGHYDLVIMSHVLEHFPKDQIVPLLRRVKALLKPGGALVVMVPNAQSHTGCYWAYEDFTHHTLFTAGSLYFVLRSAGFEAVEFLDPECLEGVGFLKRQIKRLLLFFYKANLALWNRVTSSSFHGPSPKIFSYEIKALARA